MEASDRILFLIQKAESRVCSEEELRELSLLITTELNTNLQTKLAERPLKGFPESFNHLDNWQASLQKILAVDSMPEITTPVRRISTKSWWLAASIILLLGVGIYLWGGFIENKTNEVATNNSEKVSEKDGVILKLADGSEHLLDSNNNTTIANQKGIQTKLVNGRLVYEGTGNEVVYNTILTSKGRVYQVVLPDGTKVWLNAASSIRFPTFFTENARQVEVTGEVYFEVTKNEKAPFRVMVNQQVEVTVLGTMFNVNAYEDEESIKTTLLEGSVKVGVSNSTISDSPVLQKVPAPVILRPEHQAIYTRNKANKNILVKTADISKVISWKNGLFDFDGLSLPEVMRQLARWYDIEVVYEGKIRDYKFKGGLDRDLSLEDMVQFLKDAEVPCKLSGKVLYINP